MERRGLHPRDVTPARPFAVSLRAPSAADSPLHRFLCRDGFVAVNDVYVQSLPSGDEVVELACINRVCDTPFESATEKLFEFVESPMAPSRFEGVLRR
jgi:hypothetical protein